MSQLQSQVGSSIVAFRPRSLSISNFSARDRSDVVRWKSLATDAGYDRMVIHEREAGDAPEVGDFLSIYRGGNPWAQWCLARNGRTIRVWCLLTSQDRGHFESMDEALRAVMPQCDPTPSLAAPFTLIRLAGAC